MFLNTHICNGGTCILMEDLSITHNQLLQKEPNKVSLKKHWVEMYRVGISI